MPQSPRILALGIIQTRRRPSQAPLRLQLYQLTRGAVGLLLGADRWGSPSNGLNFDNNPPSSQSADIFFTGSLASNDTAILATWPQSRAPTAAECLNWVTTHPSGSIGTVTAGMQICLKTQQGHPVLLSVVGATSDAVQAHATIWQRGTSSGSPSPSADAGAGWTVAWSGPVGITSNGVNFDNNPPSSQSADIFFTGSLASNDTAIPATWPQSRAPTAAECLNWVTTHPSGSIGTVTAGMQICLKTQQGHPVLLSVVGATSDAVQAHATIWEQQ